MKEGKQVENINLPLCNNGSNENRSSIELTKNSKGYNWVVKRYYKDTENIEDVLKEIEITEQKIKEIYGDELK